VNLAELLREAKSRKGRRKKGHTPVINTRKAFKPKALLGTKLLRNEWEWLPYHSPSAWMAEWNANLEYQKEVQRFEEEFAPAPKEGSLMDLLVQAKTSVKRGRPRKEKPELIGDPTVQTGYGLKLLELQEKYPVSSYYWNDGPSDPREIPWGDMDDLAKLVDRLL